MNMTNTTNLAGRDMPDARLATLKQGDEVEWSTRFGVTRGRYMLHHEDQVVVKGVSFLHLIDAKDILWPPAPKATPGEVYRHKDKFLDRRFSTPSGRLRRSLFDMETIPFSADWLPVDPQEERP